MQLLSIIQDIRQDHPTIGLRDLYYMINPKCFGRDKFESFCKYNNLGSKKHKNYTRTTDSRGLIRYENHIKDLELEHIDQVWVSDISYFYLNGKFYYLCFILDAYSRRIIGYCVSNRLLTEKTTLPAIRMALRTRKRKKLKGQFGLIFHSDGGGQYHDHEFIKLTREYGMINSMCEFAWENGKAERINGVIKNNYLKHRSIKNFEDLCKEVDRAVSLYNNEKPHIKLNRKTPIAYENELLSLKKQTKLKMIESLDAKRSILGASSPLKSKQTKLKNQDVMSASIIEIS
jgi:putative transposase